ncbi:MAG: carbon storage regulator CsrA [Planctomycetaceae bacterium]|nr:carbon storage regulator CsrA [Planctomycetaceae bacterium]
MLVLSRYRDESIYIGDDVIITVVDVRGDRVRLGITAPANVSVHRKEIYDAINRERRQSDGEPAKPREPRRRIVPPIPPTGANPLDLGSVEVPQ